MKILFSLFALSLCSLFAVAQIDTSVNPARHKLKTPCQITENSISSAFLETAPLNSKNYKEPKFSGMGRYTPEEMKRIRYLLTSNSVPPGLKGDKLEINKRYLPFFKAYYLGYCQTNTEFVYIIYLPKKENAHLPADLQPPSEEGSYLAVYPGSTKFKHLELAGTVPPKSVTDPVKPTVTVTTADLERFRRTKGTFVLWYGYESKITNYYAFVVDFDNKISEGDVAYRLSGKVTASTKYISYTFLPGYNNCNETYRYIARQLNIKVKEAQDLRLGVLQ